MLCGSKHPTEPQKSESGHQTFAIIASLLVEEFAEIYIFVQSVARYWKPFLRPKKWVGQSTLQSWISSESVSVCLPQISLDKVTWCDSLQANRVDGALLGDHNAHVGCPFLSTSLSMILTTLGPGRAASQIFSLSSVGNRLNSVNIGLSRGIFVGPFCLQLFKLIVGQVWAEEVCVVQHNGSRERSE